MRKSNFSWRDSIFWILPLLFLLGFYFYPLSRVVKRTFIQPDIFTQTSSSNISLGMRAVGFSFYQAFISTILTLCLGLPAAFLFGRFRFPGRRLLRLLSTLPFILPTVVVAAGFNALIGPKGWINLLLMNFLNLSQPPIAIFGSLSAILLAHVFYNTSVVIRVVGTAWERLDVKIEDAARMLGASPWKVFQKVTLPLLLPSVISAVLLVFLFDFTSFGVVLMMGGARFSTIEVEIYIQTMQFLNLEVAGVLALIQLAFSMGLTYLSQRIDRSGFAPIMPITGDEGLKRPDTVSQHIFILGMFVTLVVILVLPVLALITHALTMINPDGSGSNLILTFDNFRQIFVNERDSLFFVPPFAALKNSLLYAVSSTVISLLIGILVVFNAIKNKLTSRILNSLIMLPLGTSAVTLGLGYLLAFASSQASIAFFPILIPIAHALISLPFIVRILQPALGSIPDNQHEAAVILGVPARKLWWKFDLPMIQKPLITAAIYAFAISLGEFGATSFLSRPEYPTMPVAIFRYLGLPGAENYGKAMAMAAILLIICAGAFFIIENLQDFKEAK